ncbi:MAG: hypothetical protein HY279_13635 [Nitrospinae bacterium]|nr:hypothetical protein [Nitrospinota bacterium]
MKKIVLKILIASIVLFPFYGCATIEPLAKGEITLSDGEKVYHGTSTSVRLSFVRIKLSAKQGKLINSLYGREISHEGDVITYISAKKRKELAGIYGNIFLIQGETEYGKTDFIISISGGRIDKISSRGDGRINQEFLQQFIGRTLYSSFKVASSPADLLEDPHIIKPLGEAPKTIIAAVDAVRKVLIWGAALNLSRTH